jgi:hypothetical protein
MGRPMSARQSLDAAVRPDAGSAKAQTTLLRRLWSDHVRAHLPALIVALVFMTLEGASSVPSPGLCVRSSMSCSPKVPWMA